MKHKTSDRRNLCYEVALCLLHFVEWFDVSLLEKVTIGVGNNTWEGQQDP